ncbi:31552_t:CDS:2, partial [Gigaspora margarita]
KDYFLETFKKYKAKKNEQFFPLHHGIFKTQLQKIANLEDSQYKFYKKKAQAAINAFERKNNTSKITQTVESDRRLATINTITELLRNSKPNIRQTDDITNIIPLKDYDLQNLLIIGSIPVIKTNIPLHNYPDETFEVLEYDRHLVLKHHAEFEAFRNNVLIELGKEVQLLREIYHGAYGHKDTLELHIKLRLLTVHRAKEQFSCLKLSDLTNFNNIDWRSNNIIINGWAAPFADCFRHILVEHEKNKKVFENAQEPLKLELKTYRLITVIFTNQPFSGNYADIPLDCLLICQQNFQDYFGYIFAFHAAFAITRDSNPNFINPDHLCVALKIPRQLSGEISRKRPFRLRNEIIKKVPKMQNHLDAVKMMSFFPYEDDVRALDLPIKRQRDKYRNVNHTKLNGINKKNLRLQ